MRRPSDGMGAGETAGDARGKISVKMPGKTDGGAGPFAPRLCGA